MPIYHGRETKSRLIMSDRLRVIMKLIIDQYGQGAIDPLPADLIRRRGLLPFGTAIRQVHFPDPGTDIEELNKARSPGHRRLAFEDFLLLELALGQKREEVKKESRVFTYDLQSPLPSRLLAALPFALTAAQARVLEDIRQGHGESSPDESVDSGRRGVRQNGCCGARDIGRRRVRLSGGAHGAHRNSRRTTLSDASAPAEAPRDLLPVIDRAAVRAKKGKRRSRPIADGSAKIILGTHALIQQDVKFKQLALAVVDEQHKFGVLQRAVLKEKGYSADVLVMTATPIPRTLALTVYGDLDVSVIDAMPPGTAPGSYAAVR